MAHYAFLDETNVVVNVIGGRNENDLIDGVDSWEDYYSAETGLRCVRTSYNTKGNVHLQGGTPFRGNYAGIGYTYDEPLDAFLAPKPEPADGIADWVLNEETFTWEPVEV